MLLYGQEEIGRDKIQITTYRERRDKKQMTYSSNHKQITGDFAEHLMMYWLSKNGYECVHVRHVGIDIIASKDGERLGISVKARSRILGKTDYKFTMTNTYGQLGKVKKACEDFACIGKFAFVLDQEGSISGMLVPVEVIKKYYTANQAVSSQDWDTRKFENEPSVTKFNLKWS